MEVRGFGFETSHFFHIQYNFCYVKNRWAVHWASCMCYLFVKVDFTSLNFILLLLCSAIRWPRLWYNYPGALDEEVGHCPHEPAHCFITWRHHEFMAWKWSSQSLNTPHIQMFLWCPLIQVYHHKRFSYKFLQFIVRFLLISELS